MCSKTCFTNKKIASDANRVVGCGMEFYTDNGTRFRKGRNDDIINSFFFKRTVKLNWHWLTEQEKTLFKRPPRIIAMFRRIEKIKMLYQSL